MKKSMNPYMEMRINNKVSLEELKRLKNRKELDRMFNTIVNIFIAALMTFAPGFMFLNLILGYYERLILLFSFIWGACSMGAYLIIFLAMQNNGDKE